MTNEIISGIEGNRTILVGRKGRKEEGFQEMQLRQANSRVSGLENCAYGHVETNGEIHVPRLVNMVLGASCFDRGGELTTNESNQVEDLQSKWRNGVE